MLTREIMGVVALTVLWVNALLVVGSALQQVGPLAARLRRMRPPRDDRARDRPARERLIEGRVVRGDGRGNAVAGHRVEQVGRASARARGDASETIVFADRSAGGEIYGGVVAADGREIAIAPAMHAEVWVSKAEVLEAFACPSEARFDEGYQHARKVRGYSRTLEAKVRDGAPVWLLGVVEDDPAGPVDASARPRGARMAPALLSTIDPRAFCRAKIALLLAVSAGAIGVLSACTALALAQPRFGSASTAGAVLCLAYFLLIPAIGTAVRDAVRPPSRALVRGRWVRSGIAGFAGARVPRTPST